jgi:ketosteroid isomerase-like protein
MENEQIARKLYADFAEGNVPAVLGAFDSNIHWNDAENFIYADGNPYIGPEKILQGIFARLGSEWNPFRVIPNTFAVSGDRVFVEGRYQGTFTATGKSTDAQFMHVWTIQNGKVQAFQQYTDTLQFHRTAN